MQEKETYEEKNTSAGFDLSWDIRAGKFSKPTFGLSANRGTIDSHYRSARGQSGIFAGKGGFDIYVEKNTDLKGAVIASEATAEKNRLSTGTFSFSDLENGADYSSKSIGAAYHHYGSYDKMSRQEKNKVYNTIGLSPSLSMPAKSDANSTTTSAVAPGTIEIRKNPAQDISALNRDTSNALNELGRIFDKQKIEEQQELAKVFGEEAFRLAHNLPDDGSGRKVAVHAIIGGIMSQITGAGLASGAIGAGVNEAIIGEIKQIKDPGTAQIVSAIVGAAAAKAVGGNAGSGASAAASGTRNNHAAVVGLGAIEGTVLIGGLYLVLQEDGCLAIQNAATDVVEEIPLIADALIRTVFVAYENGQLLLEDLIEKVTDTVILYTNYGDLTPEEIIEKDKKGSVYNEFPGQWLGKPLREIEEAARNGDSAAKKAKKLLKNKRFDKNDNRK